MKRLVSILILITISCSRPVEKVTTRVREVARDISAPLGKADDAAAREKERFDQQWRQLQSFRAQQAEAQRQQQAASEAAQPPTNFRFVTGVKEKLRGLTPDSINNAPVNIPITGDVSGPAVLRAQVYFDRIHDSVGAIDGRWGRNSAITVWFFQRARGMQATGDLD